MILAQCNIMRYLYFSFRISSFRENKHKILDKSREISCFGNRINLDGKKSSFGTNRKEFGRDRKVDRKLRFERVGIRRKINRELFHDYYNSGSCTFWIETIINIVDPYLS